MISGVVGGIITWIGQLILLVGVYTLLGGNGLLVAAWGFFFICIGEAVALLEKHDKDEITILRKNIVKDWATNMAFPALWVIVAFIGGGMLFIAFAASTGVGAMLKNLRLAAILSASS